MIHMPDDDYRIRLPVFEGPIDLLVYLIRKRELDIHEISLSEIVSEYLSYVELIRMIDIEGAGEFIVMASTLMRIKSQSLFAREEPADEGDGPADPGKDLIRYLLEYEKFGEVAEMLGEQEEARRGIFPRGGERNRAAEAERTREPDPDFQLFDLLAALRDVLAAVPKTAEHEVSLPEYTVAERRAVILAALDESAEVEFVTLVKGLSRLAIVVTFVAMLELIREGRILVRQAAQFGRIILARKVSDDG